MAKSLLLVSIVLGLALSACSTPPPAPPPPAPAPVSYDGNYSGTIQVTAKAAEAGPGWCDTLPRFSVSVKDNAFTYVLAHPNLPSNFASAFQVPIGPDGSFDTQTTNGDASITGRIAATRMTGQIKGEGCDYAFAAQHS